MFPTLAVLHALIACSEPQVCEDGKIRDGDRCAAYQPSDPVRGDNIALPNGLTWQWQLTRKVDTSYDVNVYDVDLFKLTDEVRDAVLGDGRILICYFSAGSYEPWNPDAGAFSDEVIGNKLDGWPDERWLNVTDPGVRQVMADRLDLAVARGCHGVEPDNVTAYTNRSGFGINAAEQLDYNRFLADAAHERGLAVALKNDVEQIPELLDWFDFTVNEECETYHECKTLTPFVDADKAVLHAEYVDDWADAADRGSEVCGVQPGLSTIVKTWDLGPEYFACP